MAALDHSPSLAVDHASDAARAASNLARGGHVLERATWAAHAFGSYDADSVNRIVRAVAEAGAAHAEEFARMAVEETGFGVVEDKVTKNLAFSTGLLDTYAGHDYVSPRVDGTRKIIQIPRPAGVVFALTPSTNPVATTYFKVILSLMTRNAVVLSPHPAAAQVCHEAIAVLSEAASAAGAPDGIIQGIRHPTIPLVESLMADHRTSLVVATGGTPMVRAAYSSSNPALGVGPGNVPVLVDATADIRAAAREIVASKAFDNSVLCTNESVLIVEESVADQLLDEMTRLGAQLLDEPQAAQLARHMFPDGQLNSGVVGRPAHVIAQQAGIRSSPRTKVLLAPMSSALPDEPFSHEKLSPVLGVLRVPDAVRGISAARAVIRVAGTGHSAAIHSRDSSTIMNFGASVPVLRFSVNVGNSAGSSGLHTNLSPSMTIGTGFIGRSGIGENLEPRHLLNWAQVAYNAAADQPMADFAGLDPWSSQDRPVPAYPLASNDPRFATGAASVHGVVERVTQMASRSSSVAGDPALRAQIRQLVAQELSHLIKD